MKEQSIKDVNNNNPANTIHKEYISKSEIDTENIAKNIARNLTKNDIIVLTGDLGAGKTKFVYGLAKYFGIENQISSPTFTIVNEYNLKEDYLSSQNIQTDITTIYHFDVYRLQNANDFVDSVGLEYFDNGLCIIEWGEILKEILPQTTIYIHIERVDENENHRKISVLKAI